MELYGQTLDTSKINCSHSVSEKQIELLYSGPLPEQFAGISDPRIYFNVQAAQGAKVLLLAESPDGKKVRGNIEASESEIKNVLRRFFYREDGKTRFECGLTPYWLGTWAAHFMEWERVKYLRPKDVSDREYALVTAQEAQDEPSAEPLYIGDVRRYRREMAKWSMPDSYGELEKAASAKDYFLV